MNNQFHCDCVYDGSLFESQFKQKEYDCVILDVNVPGLNGLEVCLQIREKNKQIPILMLTAFEGVKEKVTAFNHGADDYLVKPFHFEELYVRLKALLRRKEVPQNESTKYTVDDLVIDLAEKTVFRKEVEIKLSPMEFKLVVLLVKSNGRVLSKNYIADALWDQQVETNPNTIEVYINFLRKKIDKDHERKLIHTKVGFGYFLKPM